jgi:Family of unknown function (DUF6491)
MERHMLRTATAVFAATLPLVVGGCASGGSAASQATAAQAPTGTPAQQRALARYMAYAGPPIPYFVWLGKLWSWEPLGKDQLVVFTVPTEAYLLKVWPPCDLRFMVNAIGITSTAQTIYAHTDSITVNTSGTGPGRWRCPIDEIRKIDYQRMRADERAQAHQGAAPPPPGTSPQGEPPQGQAAPH